MRKITLIGEIGINHNGDLNIAKELMKLAYICDWDAVKFQKRNVLKCYTTNTLNSPRESPWGDTQLAQKLGLEFGEKEYNEIDRYAKELGIDWFASAWDEDSISFLEKYDCKYNKIASAMLTNTNVLEEVAKQGKKTFISTGLSKLDDIDKAVNVFISHKCPYVLMHCVGIYPCPDEHLNLSMIQTLKNRYDCEIGYSGHSPGIMDAIIAAILGADYIEKHITIDRTMYGSDQAASLEKPGLERIKDYIRYYQRALGDGKKHVLPQEEVVAHKLRYWCENE